MNDTKNLIIFCQAPADIAHMLKIYEDSDAKSEITICVINVDNVYKFIRNLNLSVKEVIFIPYQLESLKNITALFREYKRIKHLKKQLFSNLVKKETYFFSRYEDWLTASFIDYLAKNYKNVVYYYNHYDNVDDYFVRDLSLSLYVLFKKIIYYFLTGAKFKFEIKSKPPEYILNKNIIECRPRDNQEIVKKYRHSLHSVNGKKTILLFLSSCDITLFDESSYTVRINEVLDFLRGSNYEIYLKGHPRIGPPEIFNKCGITFIPDYIPAEFIDVADVSCVIGIDSFAIINFAKKDLCKVISISNIVNFKTPVLKFTTDNFLAEFGNNNIKFINNIEELKYL